MKKPLNKRETWRRNNGALGISRTQVVTMSVSMAPDYKRRVQDAAIQLGIPVSQFVRDAIDEALLSHEG